jgi:hypothetical protein
MIKPVILNAGYSCLFFSSMRSVSGGAAPRDDTIHRAARLAESLLDLFRGRKPDSVRAGAIDIACKQLERETGEVVDPERVRDLLNRPKRRRSQP